MTDDLVQFVRDRLDEDEQTAHLAGGGKWQDSDGWADTDPWLDLPTDKAGHVLRHTPARVLADIEAKRRQLDWALTYQLMALEENLPGSDEPLQLLALPYADHPDYREEWRP